MDEMDVQPVDLSDEVRQCVQPRFAPPPVVVGRPIVRELLHESQLHALGAVIDQLTFRPSGRLDAPLQVGEVLVGGVEAERPDGRVAGRLAKNELLRLALRWLSVCLADVAEDSRWGRPAAGEEWCLIEP